LRSSGAADRTPRTLSVRAAAAPAGGGRRLWTRLWMGGRPVQQHNGRRIAGGREVHGPSLSGG
jgi:hypothetical protein